MPDIGAVKAYLTARQDALCAALEAADEKAHFEEDNWSRPEGGGGRTRTLASRKVFEKAGVAFSHVKGPKLPPAATAHRPKLAGKPWEALGLSVVIHPLNPYVPTSHANVRFFRAGDDTDSTWWFGGGFDLTPYYGFEEDAIGWHLAARSAVRPYGPDLHPRFKEACDEYFYLTHRGEPRGIGGLFYDDFDSLGFDQCFAMTKSVIETYQTAYLEIVSRRKDTPYGDRERQFQLLRRGRYVEFNLVWDRGTLFGLQSGGRTESILMSLPPLVRWEYDWKPEAGSPEAQLYENFLRPRDWLGR